MTSKWHQNVSRASVYEDLWNGQSIFPKWSRSFKTACKVWYLTSNSRLVLEPRTLIIRFYVNMMNLYWKLDSSLSASRLNENWLLLNTFCSAQVNVSEVTWINWPIRSSSGSCWVAGKMLVFSFAGAPLSVSQDATRAVKLLYCRSPSHNTWTRSAVLSTLPRWTWVKSSE